MSREELLILYTEKYREVLKRNILPLGLGLVGLILLGVGLIYSINRGQVSSKDIVFESSEQTTNKTSRIVVDVSGAVVSPGVYTLDLGSRIKDALISASGLSSDADRDWVSKNLNLASRLNDGSKIYIPRVGDPTVAASGQISPIGQTGLININSAGQSQLESLPDIGSARAQKIIDNRPYSSIEELRSKNVVGQSVFEKIKDKINVY